MWSVWALVRDAFMIDIMFNILHVHVFAGYFFAADIIVKAGR